MTELFTRWQQKKIRDILKHRRVVVIYGPRQSGKTTLAQELMTKQNTFVSLDDPILLTTALKDPIGFVQHARGTMIIDEIQKAPSLLLAIKQTVDADNRPGQFLLTGSADIRTLPSITDSLAGRISHIHLRGLTFGEVSGKKPTFLTRCFKKNWSSQIKGYDKAAIMELAFRGGYPEALHLSQARRKSWFQDYVKSLLSRDLRDIANIRRQETMKDLLITLSAWSSKFMDTASICSKLSISRESFRSYTNALMSLCLFESVPPWLRTDYERVGRKEKHFATDTGLMASLLNWRLHDVLLDSDKSGKMIETLVFNELSAQIDLNYEYTLYHYRDRENREINFVIENDRGELLGIEVKAGSAVSTSDYKHMIWFKNNIAKENPFCGIVLYTGEHALSFGEDIYAVPIAALWN